MSEDENRKVDLEKAPPAAPEPFAVPLSEPAEEPPFEHPVAEQPTPEQPAAEEASSDQPAADEQPVVEQPLAEQPADDAVHAHSATEEVKVTRPTEAPLPDDSGLANAFSPVDLPEPDEPLERPLLWASTVIATACLLLALFNADAIRSWSYDLPAGPISSRIVEGAEAWHDITASIGLTAPASAMRGVWDNAQAARFTNAPPEDVPGEEAAPEGTNTQR